MPLLLPLDNSQKIEHVVPMREHSSIADLNQLRVFAEVARTLSVTEAARVLGMPKSTVSRDVARLEKALGALLLSRVGRRIVLTEAGALFADHATQILARIEDATDAVATSTAVPHGVLTVQATYVLGYSVLMPLMASFMERFPGVDVILELENHGSPSTRDWDILFAAGALDDSSHAARKIAEMRLGLYASPEYLARRGTPQIVAELGDHDIVDKHWTRGAAPWDVQFGSGLRQVPIRPRLLLNDMLAVAFALRQGVGVGWLPSFLAQESVQARALVPVLPNLRPPPIPVYAIFPLRRSASPKIQAFVDFLSDSLTVQKP
jgi:LysR family transcriptional regulator for bpeEF and oprC